MQMLHLIVAVLVIIVIGVPQFVLFRFLWHAGSKLKGGKQ